MPFDLAHFITLDRQDGGSRAGAEVAHAFGTGSADLRYDAHAQYTDVDTGLGGYVVVPGAFRTASTFNASYLGQIELGGAFLIGAEEDRVLAAHIGVVLPTAYTVKHNAGATATSFTPRLTDYPQGAENFTKVRVGLTPQRRDGRTFSQLDLAVDLGHASAAHINAGFGIDLGEVALMIESVNIYSESRLVDSGAASARFGIGPVQPYAAFIVGMSSTANPSLHTAAVVGVDVRL